MSADHSHMPAMGNTAEEPVDPVAAAMLEELGLGRLNSLYADDKHKGKNREPIKTKALSGLDRQRAKKNADKISAWQSFEAGDVGAGENSIAGGDLHRRRQTSQFETIGASHVAPGGRGGTSGQKKAGLRNIVSQIEQLRGPSGPATRGGHPAAGRGRPVSPATATLAVDQIALARQLQREFGSSGGNRGYKRPGRPSTYQVAPARRVSATRPGPPQAQPAPRLAMPAPRPAVRLASAEDFMRTVATGRGLTASRYNPENTVSTTPEPAATAPKTPATSSGLVNGQAPPTATASQPAPAEVAEAAEVAEVAEPMEEPMEVAEVDIDRKDSEDTHDSEDEEPTLDTTRARFMVDGNDVGNADIHVKRVDDCKMLVIKVDNGDTYVVHGPTILNVVQDGSVVTLFLDNPLPSKMELSTFTGPMAAGIHRIVQSARQEPQVPAQNGVTVQNNSQPLIDLPTEAMHPLLQLLLDDFTAEVLEKIIRDIGDMNPEEFSAYRDMLSRTLVPGIENSRYAPPGLAPVPSSQNAAAVAAYMNRSSTFGTFTDAERSPFILELTRRLGEQRNGAAQDNTIQDLSLAQSLEGAFVSNGEAIEEVAQTRRLTYDNEELLSVRPNAALIDPGTLPLVGRSVQQLPRPPQPRRGPAVVPNAAPPSVSSVRPHPQIKQESSKLNENGWMQELLEKKAKAEAKPSTAVEPRPSAPVPKIQVQGQSAVHQQGPAPVFGNQAQNRSAIQQQAQASFSGNQAQGQKGFHQQAPAAQTAATHEIPAPLAQAPNGNINSPAANDIGNAVAVHAPTMPASGTVIYYSAPAEQETPKPFKSGLENSKYADAPPQYLTHIAQSAHGPPQHPSPAPESKSGARENDGKEICRFLLNCSSKNCGFVHPECNYHPVCTNPKCAYTHPKHKIAIPCKYQSNCNKEGCPYEHGHFCKYKPCKNPICKWEHFPSQQLHDSRRSSTVACEDSDSVAGLHESLSNIHLNSGSSTPARYTAPRLEVSSDVIAVAKYDKHGKRELDESGQPAIVLVPRSSIAFPERENRFPNNGRAATPSLSPSRRANMNSMNRGRGKENVNPYEEKDEL